MNSIIYDDEIITPKNNRYQYYYNFIEKLDKRDCVKFALFCAKIANNNSKKSNDCIELVEKWLKDEKSVNKQELWNAANSAGYYATAYYATAYATSNSVYYSASNAAYAAYYAAHTVIFAANATIVNSTTSNIGIINKYLQILLRKTKQFQNNKILEQISKTDVDKLELVDWNMITDIMQEEYNVIHEFEYEDIFSRRCLIELLRREYV